MTGVNVWLRTAHFLEAACSSSPPPCPSDLYCSLTKKPENRLVPYAVYVHCNYMAGIGFYCSGLRFVPMSAFATSTGGTSSPLLCRDMVQDSLTNKLVLLSLTGEHHECCAIVYTVLLCPCGYHPAGTRSRSDIDVYLNISPVQLIDACELTTTWLFIFYILHPI